MLDGESVSIKDSVYVLGVGYCPVSGVNPDGSFTVKTRQGETFFRAGGLIGNKRRVYWHDPMRFAPPKSATLWNAIKKLCENVYEQVETFRSI